MVVHKGFVEKAKIDEVILSRLKPEEDLFAGLIKIAKDHGIERGAILSAIGSLRNVVFGNVRPHTHLTTGSGEMIEIDEEAPLDLL